MDIVSAMDFPFRIDVHLSGPSSPTYLVWVKSELFILIPAAEKKCFCFWAIPFDSHPRGYLTGGAKKLKIVAKIQLNKNERKRHTHDWNNAKPYEGEPQILNGK